MRQKSSVVIVRWSQNIHLNMHLIADYQGTQVKSHIDSLINYTQQKQSFRGYSDTHCITTGYEPRCRKDIYFLILSI